MNILFIQKVKGISGSEKVLLNLSAELISRGHTIIFLVYTEPGYDVQPFIQGLEQAGVTVVTMVLKRFSFSVIRRTRELIEQHAFDIVHTHLIHADIHGIFAARKAGHKRIVSTKHNDDPFRKGLIIRLVERYLLNKTQSIIAVSHYLKRFLSEQGTPAARINVIYNGVASADTPVKSREALRQELNCGPDETVFLIGARLIRQKGHAELLQAFKLTCEKHPDAVLLIAGDGDRKQELIKLTAELGLDQKVRFLNYRNDLYQIMLASDIFVHPSLWEGFGLVLVEAMQAGLPVIATNISAIPEVVDEGISGILCPPRDIRQLADAMIDLAGDKEKRLRMGEAGQSIAAERFSISHAADQLLELYQGLITGETGDD